MEPPPGITTKKKLHFDWVDALKAFAILGILLNHLLEEFGPIVWFTNPSDNWPDLTTRLQNLIPEGDNWLERSIYLLGWLGDSGPGVFILLSGFGLTLSAMRKPDARVKLTHFFQRRLKRIFPLYLAVHVVTLIGAFFVFGQGYIHFDLKLLFSLLGLRFADSLFFYINPSWWFIWIMLQFYLLFPLLLWMMKKAGLAWFFGLTVLATVLFRYLGLEGVRYSDSLYYWMTGIFCGTRLAEFTLGMVLAAVAVNRSHTGLRAPKLYQVLILSTAIYTLGLFAAVFWFGTLIANLLVTIGLCGLFYGIWELGIKRQLRFLKKPVVWIGMNSFGVFLIHQAPMMWAGSIIESTNLRFITSLSILMLSFPFALVIEKLVARTVAYAEHREKGQSARRLSLLISGSLIVMLAIMEGVPETRGLYYGLSLLSLSMGLALWVLELKTPLGKYPLTHFCLITGIIAAIFKLFLLPSWNSLYALAAGIVIAAGIVFSYRLTKKRALAWVVTLLTSGVVLLSFELLLRKVKPLETPNRWGEYPAMEIHPTRVYGLKPSLKMRLKYNNYDYVLKTNSQGLASPEISAERPDANTFRVLLTGDAFSMPEGVPYELAYPFLLKQRLDNDFPSRTVQVINGGVTGYGPNESLAQLKELVPLYQPDIVIYQFFINEFAEVTLSREDRLYNIGLLSNLSLINRELLRSQILAYKRKFEEAIVEWLRKEDSSSRHFKSLLPFYEKKTDLYHKKGATEKIEEILSQMKALCAQENTDFILVFVPGQIEVSKPEDVAHFPRYTNINDTTLYDLKLPFRQTSAIADSLDIYLLDLTPALKAHDAQPVYFPASWHWNPEGHKVVAQAIFEVLKSKH